MTDLRLTDTVDTTKTLLESVGVPRQVVVNHQMRSLEVDAFPGGVRGNQDADVFVLSEFLLDLTTLVAEHAALNGRDGVGVAEERADFVREIAQRIPMFREDNEFFTLIVMEHAFFVLEQFGEFVPLAVFAAHSDVVRQPFQILERVDFRLEFRNRARGGRFFRDVFLFALFFVGRVVFFVVFVVVLGVVTDVGLVFLGAFP